MINIKNIVLGMAIIVLTMFVTIYGINTFYERPEYKDFCGEFKTAEIINDQDRCEEIGGQWADYNTGDVRREALNGELLKGFCDRDYTCRQNYDSAMEKYSKNIFLIALPLGILIIFLGAYLFSLEAVGAGLMGGGVGTLIYGSGGYWRYADDRLKFVLSLVGLVALIFFAYKFNQEKKSFWKRLFKGRR